MLTNESTLRKVLLEIALGVDPDFGSNGRDDKDVRNDSRKSKVPVSPSIQSSIQLSSDSPPIRDADFLPSNKHELAKSLYAIGEMIDDADSAEFYEIVRDAYAKFTGDEIV